MPEYSFAVDADSKLVPGLERSVRGRRENDGARLPKPCWGFERIVRMLILRPMSIEGDMREKVEKLKRVLGDAKRLKRELSAQIKEIDAKLGQVKALRSSRKKTGI